MRSRLLHVILALLLLILIGQQIQASGVFELEFLKLQPLETTRQLNRENNSDRTTEQQVSSTQSNENLSNLIQVFVCLKEAFTSQLDGPCTFGNASITLYKDSILQEPNSKRTSSVLRQRRNPDEQNSTTMASMIAQQQQQQQQGSLLTNVVRILFTFRWTVSSGRFGPYL